MAEKFFITTPIYYVNDEPHLGHAYSTVIADILARYHRLIGDRVFFLTGTDEHGQKVAEASAAAGRTPREHCDLMVVRFQELWERLNIEFDDFIRTTEDRHIRRVQTILQQLWDAGEIYASEYEGWYCVPEERFWTEKDLQDGKCPSCGREVRLLREKNYFFRMGKYQQRLIDHIKSHDRFILPESRRKEVLGFLQQPLGDLCISRPRERLSWGVPIPFDENYVTYVWFDALLNYVTAPESRGGGWWPASIHLIGKDILTTHSVYWPTMLMAAGLELPETIFGHGWWLANDTKMSKSLGNVVKPLDLADQYGVDAFRFFLAREMSLGMDASFSEEALVNRYNSELANDLGNLFSRLLKLLHTFCGGEVPPRSAALEDGDVVKNDWIRRVVTLVRNYRLNAALDEIMAFVRSINKNIEDAAPWKTGKTDPEGTRRFLRSALEDFATAACLLFPVMPNKMGEALELLGLRQQMTEQTAVGAALPAGRRLPERAALFPRIKAELKPREEGGQPQKTGTADYVTADDFRRIQLKAARILTASRVVGTQKLLQLTVDAGDGVRTLVAGIAASYAPEELIGKSVVVVANLQPTKIRGIESQGMLLAGEGAGKLVLIVPETELPPGAKIS
jgi:methionyl-tRNA synthetase